jgi:hypothetical protein
LKFQLTTSFQWRNKGQWLKLKDLSLASWTRLTIQSAQSSETEFST